MNGSVLYLFWVCTYTLYNWDDMKQYSKKSIGIMIGIIVVCSLFVGVILIEGQKQMEKMSIFQEWMSSAKSLYIVIVVVIFLRIVISIASYILKGEVEWGVRMREKNRLLWCARLFTIISYFRAIFKSEWVPVILCIGVLILLLCIARMSGKHIAEKENCIQY